MNNVPFVKGPTETYLKNKQTNQSQTTASWFYIYSTVCFIADLLDICPKSYSILIQITVQCSRITSFKCLQYLFIVGQQYPGSFEKDPRTPLC